MEPGFNPSSTTRRQYPKHKNLTSVGLSLAICEMGAYGACLGGHDEHSQREFVESAQHVGSSRK